MFGRHGKRSPHFTTGRSNGSSSLNRLETFPFHALDASLLKNDSPLGIRSVPFMNFDLNRAIVTSLLIRCPAANASVRKWSPNALMMSGHS